MRLQIVDSDAIIHYPLCGAERYRCLIAVYRDTAVEYQTVFVLRGFLVYDQAICYYG